RFASLPSRLTGFATNHFVRILDAFAFVRVRLAQRADLRRRLADLLFVDSGDDDVPRLAVDLDVDAFRNREAHRMRVSKLEDHFLPFDLRAVADADDVELLLEALGHALNV